MSDMPEVTVASEWQSQVEDIADLTLTIIIFLLLYGIIAMLQSPPITTKLRKKSVFFMHLNIMSTKEAATHV